MDERALRREMCRIGSLLWQRGHIGATEGNLSCRLHSARILATPGGFCKGTLRPDDLIALDHSIESTPASSASSEIRLHLGLYEERPDCRAVVHAHPIAATAYAMCAVAPQIETSPEAMVVLGQIAVVPFAMPGTEDLPKAIAPFSKEHKTFLLANHGAVTIGSSLEDAFNRLETLERFCRSSLLAKLVGNPQPIPAEAMAALQPLISPDLQ